MRIEAFGQQYVCAQVHGPSPEIRQQLALHLHVFDVLRVLGRHDRWNDFVEQYLDRLRFLRIDLDLLRCAVEITRGAAPLLTFAAIHWQFDSMTIRSFEGLIAM